MKRWIFPLLLLLPIATNASDGGSVQNYYTLNLMPLASSNNNPIGGAVGLAYNRYHVELKTYYELAFDASIPYSFTGNNRVDLIPSLAFFTQITPAFSLGARVGAVVNNPGSPVGLGALGLRLPALYPTEKQFFSFFFEEIDLGLAGAGTPFASFRLGMLLL